MGVETGARIEARELARRHGWAAARVFADAFLHDPVWLATGPRLVWHRRLALSVFYLAEVLVARRRSAILLGAYRGRRLDAAMIVFPDGERLFPWWVWLPRSVACVLAGPVAVARSLRVVAALDRLHPRQPHAHFWLLGSRSDSLGAGYVLMREATSRTDALGRPGYLEATSPEMARAKELLGWRVRGTCRLPTGAVVTTMWRDCPARP